MEEDKTTPNDIADYYGDLVCGGKAMDVKQLLGAIVGMIAKIAVAAVVIVLVFKGAVGAYEFGYQLFADVPVSEGEGRVVSVIIEDGQGSKEIANLLEQKGLIQDANVFYIQEQLSDYKGAIKAGVYELNTAMNSDEMLRIMCQVTEESEE